MLTKPLHLLMVPARMFIPCVILLTSLCLLPSCGVIVGGSNYFAHVKVKDHPDATIFHNGIPRGTGNGAYFKAKRSQANQFHITVKEKGCNDLTVNFVSRKFRWGAFVGTVVGWTGVTPDGVYLPWGIVVDLIAGSLWKPDMMEPGVTKVDYKTYFYLIDYPGCESKDQSRLSNPDPPTGTAFVLNPESDESPAFEYHLGRNTFVQ